MSVPRWGWRCADSVNVHQGVDQAAVETRAIRAAKANGGPVFIYTDGGDGWRQFSIAWPDGGVHAVNDIA